jgi:hypothetical protein
VVASTRSTTDSQDKFVLSVNFSDGQNSAGSMSAQPTNTALL